MGDPLGTTGHTQTGSPHLSDQGRCLKPRTRNLNQNTFMNEAQPTQNPNSPEHRLYTGTSGAGESLVLYKALDSRPGGDNGVWGKNTVTLLYQPAINVSAEANQSGT